MSEVRNDFAAVISNLMEGAEGVLTSKTVVGSPVRIGEEIIVPLSDVSIGCGAGANGTDHQDKGMGGFAAKMSPTAVLIIKNGQTKVVNIKEQTAVTKLVDIIPDVIDMVSGKKKKGVSNDDAIEVAFSDEDVEEPVVEVKTPRTKRVKKSDAEGGNE